MGAVAAVTDMAPGGKSRMGSPVVCWFEECRKDSVPLVGGKCSSLGELIGAGVRVPPGFALTTEGYRRFMAEAGIAADIQSLLRRVDASDAGRLLGESGIGDLAVRSAERSAPTSSRG